MTIRPLRHDDVAAVRDLATTASSEGFRFLGRFVTALENGALRLDAPDEFFLCAVANSRVIGVAGVTPDPFTDDPHIGRIRHVYIHPEWRRNNVGRLLLREIETRAQRVYSTLRLRTDTEPAARFYETVGYRMVRSPNATHVRPISSGQDTRPLLS